MSKSDWYWFTGLFFAVIAIAGHDAPELVRMTSCIFSWACMITSLFMPEHPTIDVTITVVEPETNHSQFGVHTSEDK